MFILVDEHVALETENISHMIQRDYNDGQVQTAIYMKHSKYDIQFDKPLAEVMEMITEGVKRVSEERLSKFLRRDRYGRGPEA